MLYLKSTSSKGTIWSRSLVDVSPAPDIVDQSIYQQWKSPNRYLPFPILVQRRNDHLQAQQERGFSFERNCVLRRWESETLN